MRAVGQACELPLVRHAQFEAEIALHYGEKANEPMLSMADVPQGAELLTGEGLFIPVVRVRNVYILPGVPELFQRKVAGIAERFRGRPFHLGKLFVDLDEGDIAAMLEVAQGSFPSVEIGSYPRYDDADYRVMVTFESKDLEAVRQVRAELLSRLPAEAVLRQE